jgi:protein phosphatase
MSTLHAVTLRAVGATHHGRVRANNEDAYHAAGGVYVVADGMGGHQAGEVASEVAIETVRLGRDYVDDLGGLTTLVGEANAAILARADQNPDQRGMGTTLTGLVVVGALDDPSRRLAAINVGDSRTYRWRNGELQQLTTDHSYVQDLVASGVLTTEEARHHPRRNIVTRALGVESVVVPDVIEVDAALGDRFVVCSDGLVDEVADDEIATIIASLPDPQALADALVERALDHGGRDNVTVVVVDVISGPDNVAPIEPVLKPESAPVVPDLAGGRRRLLGIALFVLALIVVVGATIVAVGAYARSGFYVDFDDGDEVVVIYQGRPGGVWWFDSTTREVTTLRRQELGPVDIERISTQPTFGALSDLRLYLTTVTTTTTTTTVPTTVPR